MRVFEHRYALDVGLMRPLEQGELGDTLFPFGYPYVSFTYRP